MTEKEITAIINRQRRLPDQIRAMRQKLSMLLVEASRYGMLADILFNQFNGDLMAMESMRMMEAPLANSALPGLLGYSEGLV